MSIRKHLWMYLRYGVGVTFYFKKIGVYIWLRDKSLHGYHEGWVIPKGAAIMIGKIKDNPKAVLRRAHRYEDAICALSGDFLVIEGMGDKKELVSETCKILLKLFSEKFPESA